MIGDPSGRVTLSAFDREQMRSNMATYEAPSRSYHRSPGSTIERHYNSEWMGGLTVRDWVETLKRT